MNNKEYTIYKLKFIFSPGFYETIYTLSVILLSIRSVLGLSQMDNEVFRYFTIVAYSLLIMKLLFSPYTKRSFMQLIVLLLLVVIIYNITQNTLLIGTVLYIYAAIDVDKMKVIKAASFTIFIMVIIIALSSLCGKIPILVNGYITFGFNNPNGFQQFISIATIMLIAANFRTVGLFQLFFFTGLNLLTSFISGSNMGFLIAMYLFWIAVLLKRPNHKHEKIDFKIEKWTLFIIVFVLILVTFYKVLPFVQPINTLLSGRIMQANNYFNEYGIHLFGSHILELDPGYKSWHLLLDCGYARLFINYGIIYGVIFVVMVYQSLKKYRETFNVQSIIAILGFVLILVAENGALGINFNMALILLSNTLG